MMALDSGYFETAENGMTKEEAAALLVEMHAEHRYYAGSNDQYTKAVAVVLFALGREGD